MLVLSFFGRFVDALTLLLSQGISLLESYVVEMSEIFSCDVPFAIHNVFLGTISADFDHLPSKTILFDLFIPIAFKVILTCWKDNSKLSFLLWWNLICDEHRIASVSHSSIFDLLWLPFTAFLSSHSSFL